MLNPRNYPLIPDGEGDIVDATNVSVSAISVDVNSLVNLDDTTLNTLDPTGGTATKLRGVLANIWARVGSSGSASMEAITNAATKPANDPLSIARVTSEGDIELLPKILPVPTGSGTFAQKIRLGFYRLTDELRDGVRSLTLRRAVTGELESLRCGAVYVGDSATPLQASQIKPLLINGNRTLTPTEIAHSAIVLRGTPSAAVALTLPNTDFYLTIINEMTVSATINRDGGTAQATLESASAMMFHHLA